jgi:hypothetical protein
MTGKGLMDENLLAVSNRPVKLLKAILGILAMLIGVALFGPGISCLVTLESFDPLTNLEKGKVGGLVIAGLLVAAGGTSLFRYARR